MFFNWSKASNPSQDAKTASVDPLFTNGRIVLTDGSAVEVASLEEKIERTPFVPLSFTQAKVSAVVSDFDALKIKYEEHVVRMKEHFDNNLLSTKKHYENYIVDLKSKAIKHVELERLIRNQQAIEAAAKLKASEDKIEELRDSLAALNLESQERIRELKKSLASADQRIEIMSKNLADVNSRLVCMASIDAVLLKQTTQFHLNMERNKDEQLSSTVKSHEAQVNELNMQLDEIKSRYNTEREEHMALADTLTKQLADANQSITCLQNEMEMVACKSTIQTFVANGINEAKISWLSDRLLDAQAKYNAAVNDSMSALHDAAEGFEKKTANLKELLSATELELKEINVSDRVKSKTILQLTCRAALNDVIQQIESSDANEALKHEMELQKLKYEEQISNLNAEIQHAKDKFASFADSSDHAQQQEITGLQEQFQQDLGRQRNMLEETHFIEMEKQWELSNQLGMELEETRSRWRLAVVAPVAITTVKEEPVVSDRTDLVKIANDTAAENDAIMPEIKLPTRPEAVKSAAIGEDEEETERRTNPPMLKNMLTSQFTMTFNGDDNNREEIVRLESEVERLQRTIKSLETQVALLSNQMPTIVETQVMVGEDYSAEIAALGEDIIRYDESLRKIRAKELELRNQTAYYSNQKKAKKNEIKSWVQAFREEHNRAPDKGDKEEIQETFQAYQEANDNLAECNKVSQELAIEERGVEEQLNIAKMTFSRLNKQRVVGETGTFAGRMDIKSRANDEAIEELEDQIFNLQEEIAVLKSTLDKSADANLVLQGQLEMFVKEKRSDVVKQFELEIATLTAAQKDLHDTVASLTAAKSKAEMKMHEFKERAEQVETELKRRDDIEAGIVTPADEKKELKLQVNKQREAIVLKTKAATAGWDAAADADERLTKEVDAAYSRGLKEGRQKNSTAWDALNAAVEVKENRITELMVSVVNMEDRVRKANEESLAMQQQLEAAKLEVADTISMFAGGGEGSGGASSADLDAARESLDAAQEEVVVMNEKCDSMQNEIAILEQKIAVYEQLVNEKQGDRSIPAVAVSNTEAVGGNVDDHDAIAAVLVMIKNVLGKGTGLWKASKRKECFALYQKACEDAVAKLNRKLAVRGSLVDALGGARQSGSGAQGKTKAAVNLRKSLDNAIIGLQNALDAPESPGSTAVTSAKLAMTPNATLLDSLQSQLAILDRQRQVTIEMRSVGGDEATPSPDKSSSGSASLLKRAKAAEAKVEILKKQLANALQGRTDSDAADTSVVEDKAGGAKPVAGKAAAKAAAAKGADPAEVRKLQRQIKELEVKLTAAETSGGGADKKALAAAEKAQQKKIKDMETSFRKEKAAMESRAIKAEGALEAATASLPLITAERDQLRVKVKELTELVAEVAVLREQAAKGAEYQASLQEREAELTMLQVQFKKETFLRKKYKNELEDLKGTVRVYARCRPFAQYELDRGCATVVTFPDETSVKVVTTRGEKVFEFDNAFTPQSTQQQVFEDTKRLVESCMDGFNVCLFAYGQTGSGKTHTMTGTPSAPGITPSAIDELFHLIKERVHCVCTVSTYFVELYNDNLVDLYWPIDNDRRKTEPPKLEIKMDEKKMVYIKGVAIKEANSPAMLMELFNLGNAQRHTGATKMNAESSRSHSIFAIMVSCYDRNTKKTATGKLSLVDLAGSERADKTGASAERLKEAQNINTSLSALGNVIAALSEGEKFIPYRDNKLTQLMQDSLGGNAKTLMFVNFSPADYNCDETVSSLTYATRVKKITNNASKQAESEEVARLKAIIKRLQGGGGGGGPVELNTAALIESPPAATETVDVDDDNPDFDYNILE